MALWALGTLPFLTRLFRGRTSVDVQHLMLSANALLDGKGIYVDVPFAYPPYVFAWLAGPAMLAGNLAQFRLFFGLLILCLDALVKAALIWTGFRDRHRPPDALPFVMYTLATAALGHILLQRYDVIPAALSVAAVMALSAGWAGVAGLMAAIAVGTKAYPAVFVPVLAVVAWRRSQSDAKRFTIGVVAGLLPLIALSWSLPWWNFATVHTRRGLEAESLWASALWLSHFVGVPATWELTTAWFEVTGPVAEGLVAPARIVWASRDAGECRPRHVGRLAPEAESWRRCRYGLALRHGYAVAAAGHDVRGVQPRAEPAIPSLARAAGGAVAARPAPAGRRGRHWRPVVHLPQVRSSCPPSFRVLRSTAVSISDGRSSWC